jgi:hypothetical protein
LQADVATGQGSLTEKIVPKVARKVAFGENHDTPLLKCKIDLRILLFQNTNCRQLLKIKQALFFSKASPISEDKTDALRIIRTFQILYPSDAANFLNP